MGPGETSTVTILPALGPYVRCHRDAYRSVERTSGIGICLDDLVLTGYFPSESFDSEEETITNIKDQCGWDLKVAPDIKDLPLPNSEELKFLRCFDPLRYFLGNKGEERRDPFAK